MHGVLSKRRVPTQGVPDRPASRIAELIFWHKLTSYTDIITKARREIQLANNTCIGIGAWANLLMLRMHSLMQPPRL